MENTFLGIAGELCAYDIAIKIVFSLILIFFSFHCSCSSVQRPVSQRPRNVFAPRNKLAIKFFKQFKNAKTCGQHAATTNDLINRTVSSASETSSGLKLRMLSHVFYKPYSSHSAPYVLLFIARF